MRLLIVNPNSTASMTDKIRAAARSVAAPGTDIIAVNPTDTPASIEGYADEALCVGPLLREVEKGAAEGADAVIVACFDDPGLAACRTITDVPVVGICEAAMLVASSIAARFEVVTTLRRAVPIVEELALRYGMERKCSRVSACEVPVLSLEVEGSPAQQRVRQAVADAAQNGAEAVILGCAGMADLAAQLTRETGVPVIDGVAAATKWAEALAGLGVRTSKVGGYAPPRDKSDVSVAPRVAAE